MDLGLSILYRGALASCNYSCWYCPFAKQVDSPEELEYDRKTLARFVDWVLSTNRPLSVLFTPWGEALVRRHYREAMLALSHAPHVQRVAAQTNLAYRLDWLADANRDTLALWCTYHPEETTEAKFLERCHRLDELGVRYSVGTVGLIEQIDAIESLRAKLHPDVYLWVNAFKRQPDYYAPEHIKRLQAVDPLFPLNRNHASLGKACRTGETAISVYEDGTIQRCHFIKQRLGNLYEDDLDFLLKPRACTAAQCGCHIGFAHLDHLGLYDTFGDGLLERVPREAAWKDVRKAMDYANRQVPQAPETRRTVHPR